MAPYRRDRGPKMSKWQAEKAERNRQSLARLNRALPRIFPSAVLSWALGRPFVPPTPRLAVDLYRRARIRSAPIGWRVRLLLGAERPEAGLGSSAITASMDYPPHIERHPRPIGNAHTRRVRDFAACAANRCIASVGMSICGMAAPT